MFEQLFRYSQFEVNIDFLLQKVKSYLPNADVGLIGRAYEVACKAQTNNSCDSNEALTFQILYPALVLADLRLDEVSLTAALLRDVTLNTDPGRSLDTIRDQFGSTVADIIDGVTKLEAIALGDVKNWQAESLRKLILALSDDIRVVMVKLALQLHKIQQLDELSEEMQTGIARETLDIYAPLAYHLGIWSLKSELEDMAFLCLKPNKYDDISELLAKYQVKRRAFVERIIETVEIELRKSKITAAISGRAKHLYGIYQKMLKRDKKFNQVYDVFAIRIIVPEIQDCYAALGIVHSLWQPVPKRVKDYIAVPRNNYRSLHTTLLVERDVPLEVQIRTQEMHTKAEYGVAAHWRYRDWRYNQFGVEDNFFAERIAQLQQLAEIQHEIEDASEFAEMLKFEISQKRVYIFTPKRDIYELPKGSTPVDFAYHIHTEVGHHCRGAKVNGRIVPLNYKLKNGEEVEVLTAKRGGPSRDWINPHLGYIKTSRARSKVRHWFKYQNYEENVSQGRGILERELRRLGLSEMSFEKLAQEFQFNKVDHFLAAIGRNDVNTTQIVNAIKEVAESVKSQDEEEWQLLLPFRPPARKTSPAKGVQVQGVGDMLTNLAQCCRPVPGDAEIIGYITRGRGVTIHRVDCPNILHFYEKAPERLITVNWGQSEENSTYPVDVYIEAFDRPGLLQDITAIAANEKINLSTVSVATKKTEHKATVMATLDIANIDQLSRVLAKIEQLPNVVAVERRK